MGKCTVVQAKEEEEEEKKEGKQMIRKPGMDYWKNVGDICLHPPPTS
jgi:hypothetical protein